jgi:hypothetical protein
MKTLVFLAALAFAGYWFLLRDGCGTRGAIACPAAALEEGVGTELSAADVCPDSGYLCTGRPSFQVARWQLDKGRLRVRITLPEFVDERTGREIREAALEGIMQWDRHPFPLVIDAGKYTARFWDVGVVWTQGLNMDATGLVYQRGEVDGKRFVYSVDSLAVVVPPIATGGGLELTPSSDPGAMLAQVKAMVAGEEMGPALLARVKATAMHEMGHALGLMHSDRESDIMFPRFQPGVTPENLSARDLRTVDALYTLPNGAMVQ